MKVSWEISFGGKQGVIFFFIWGMLKNIVCLNVEIMQSIWIYCTQKNAQLVEQILLKVGKDESGRRNRGISISCQSSTLPIGSSVGTMRCPPKV